MAVVYEPGSDWRDAARALVPVLQGRAHEAEARGHLPDATVRALVGAGLTRMLQPREFGGGGASVAEFVEVCAVLAHGCVSSAWCNFVWGVHNFVLGLYPRAVQRALWDADPTLLTSASIGPVGKAVAEGDGLAISGRWGFNSGCDHAGALLLGAMSERGPWLSLLRRGEYTLIDNWQVAGLEGTGSKDAEAACAVPRGWAQPFSHCVEPHRALLTLVIIGPVLGAAESAVAQYAEAIRPGADAVARQRLADVSARADAARLVVQRGCAEIDAALGRGAVPEPSTQLRIARDAAFAARLCRDVVNEVFAASSGRALHRSHPLQRIWRDVAAGCSHHRLRWDMPAEDYAVDRLASME